MHKTVKAQFNETIRTGRPGQAIGPFAVGSYVFQTQTGIDVGGFSSEQNNNSNFNIAPNTVLRFGIAKHFEINSAWEYRWDRNTEEDTTTSMNGLSLSAIGTRINLYEGGAHLPAIGLQISFKMPILSSGYNFDYTAPKILFIASDNISDKFSFLLNFGLDYNGNDAEPTGVYIANIGYSLSPQWSIFLENYGNAANNRFENKWDAGIAYLLDENLQFDLYGGAGYNYGQFSSFASIGASWRVVALRNEIFPH